MGGYLTAISMTDNPNAVEFDSRIQTLVVDAFNDGKVITENLDIVDITPEISQAMSNAMANSEYLLSKNNAAKSQQENSLSVSDRLQTIMGEG